LKLTGEKGPASIQGHFSRLLASKLARASVWLLFGGVIGGILGYVFQVLMGRMLSTQEYGLFSARWRYSHFLGLRSEH
jgi:hypothetical protein